MPEDEIVAVIGTETSPRSIPSSARRAYDGFQCNECRRVCGVVDSDGRCQTCGPIPVEKPELTESDKSTAAFAREREIAERHRRDRL
jgi:hypothetical protein